MEGIGLAHLYPALAWSVCAPGHRGYFDTAYRTAAPALIRFERWCGFGQAPSDAVHFVPVLSDVVDGVWFFSAALVGPIANLNAAPFSESNADANCGIAIANAPIPISRSTWRPMMFMM